MKRFVTMTTCMAAAIMAGAAAPGAQAAAAGYSYTVIAAPGAQQTGFNAMNASGSVVGFWVDKAQAQHGFVFAGGKLATLDIKGAAGTSVTGINKAGDIVGYASDSAGNTTGFMRVAGKLSSLAVPGATFTEPLLINDAGDIAGVYIGHGQEGGFVDHNGAFTTFTIGINLFITGFNNAGTLLGFYNDAADNQYGFIRIAGKNHKIGVAHSTLVNPTGLNASNGFVAYYHSNAVSGDNLSGFVQAGAIRKTIAYPGVAVSEPSAINDAGHIAGYFTPAGTGTLRSYVYDGKAFTQVGPVGSTEADAEAINDAGQIAGNFADAAGGQVFLATPK